MPRPAATSIDDVVQTAVHDVIARAAKTIAAAIAQMAAAELEEQLSVSSGPARRASRAARARRQPREEITKWVADRNARRAPNFVIEMTGGLDTKKKIVAKYGENAAFEKGKPVPAPSETTKAQLTSGVKTAARTVKAKAPSIRKAPAA